MAIGLHAVTIPSYLNWLDSHMVADTMMSILPLLAVSIRGLASASNSFNPSTFRANIKNLCRIYDLSFDTIWTDLGGDKVNSIKARKAFMVK
jgi:hypothetical protein